MKRVLVQVLWFILALHPQSVAQRAGPIAIESALKMREFADGAWPEVSPDGRWVSYLTMDRVRELQVTKGSQDLGSVYDIWVTSVETSASKNITAQIGASGPPSWSPNGRQLAFFADRDGSGSPKLWVWNAESDTLRKVADAPGASLWNKVEWLPDNRSFLAKLAPETDNPAGRTPGLPTLRTISSPGPRIPGPTVTVFRSSPKDSTVSESAWSLDASQCDLSLVDASTGAVRRIAKGIQAYKVSISPDGSHAAISVAIRFARKGSQQILYDIRSIDLRTWESQIIASEVRLSVLGIEFTWSPDSSMLAYCLSGQDEPAGDCFVVNPHSHAVGLNVTHFPPKDAGWPWSIPAWSPDAQRLYCIHDNTVWVSSIDGAKSSKAVTIPHHHIEQLVATRNGALQLEHGSAIVLTRDDDNQQSGFFRIDLNRGSQAVLLERNENYTRVPPYNVSISDDGSIIAFVSQNITVPPDIWVSDNAFRHPRQLTHLNPALESYSMGQGKSITWTSLDGQTLHGALLLPAGYTAGQKCPLIVWVYSGSNYSVFLHYFGLSGRRAFNFQLLATRGYAVLMPDAPEHPGAPMADLIKTVLPGVEKVVEMGIADSSRVGIGGHSRGGYTALSMIVQTNRFKAAVMIDGFGDLMSQYGELRDDGTAFQPTTIESRLGGTPWQFRERYIENSPLFYLDRVQTPLLIVHGMEDRNVFPNRSDEIFVALRRLGKEAMYARYDGEKHVPTEWTYANQLDLWNRVISWFDKYLMAEQQ